MRPIWGHPQIADPGALWSASFPRNHGESRLAADGKEVMATLSAQAGTVRAALSSRPGRDTIEARAAARALLAASLPAAVQAQIRSAARLIMVPDGPLHGISFEGLIALADDDSTAALLADKAIVYAPSATAYVRLREGALNREGSPSRDAASAASGSCALILAPVFDHSGVLASGGIAKPRGGAAEYPTNGTLIAAVPPGGQAQALGLQRGDVLLTYDGRELTADQPLSAVIAGVGEAISAGTRSADTPIAISYWRAGEVHRASVQPGKLGVQIQPGDPGEVLRIWARLDQITRAGGLESLGAAASMADWVRLFGGRLDPLPGTRQEAEAIKKVVQQSTPGAPDAALTTVLLLGEDATVPKLREAIGRGVPRYLHLATHGLTGSRERPYDASLALTQPNEPSPNDIGFLTLDELMSRWLNRLKGCELVVLSACDTGRGIQKGDSVMALPIGFFAAGVPTVIASLWKVDDAVTALFMDEFYRNLLERGLPKAQALRATQRALRDMTRRDAEQRADRLGIALKKDLQIWLKPVEPGQTLPPGPQPSDRLFEHPYYWAAFILIGAPD